ncbi:MAG: hypothetical protein ACYCYI_09635 [Saccharofermentanales bacterium]
MDIITEWTVEQGGSTLLTSGLPVAAGILHPSDPIMVVSVTDNSICPFWYEPRSFWPDGSIRWLFMHVITSPDEQSYRLIRADENIAHTSSFDKVSYDICLLSDGFTVSFDNLPSMKIRYDIDCSLPSSEKNFNISKIEDSPLAPLYMIENIQDGHADVSFIIRLDLSCAAISIICRHSLRSPDAVIVRRIGFYADILSDKLYLSDNATQPNTEDIGAHTGHACAVIINGSRRGPVQLSVSDRGANSFDMVISAPDTSPLEVTGGTSLRQEIRLSPGNDRSFSHMILPKGYVASTEVFGPVPDLSSAETMQFSPGLVSGLTRLFENGYAQSDSIKLSSAGILNDGDWLLNPGQYGACGYRAYADNEYDTPFAYFLAHAACGRQEYLDLALRGSIHMADIDCQCTTGDMLYHGYNESAEDHSTHRVNKGELGHYWTDGLWSAYFWTGDLFAREAAIKLTNLVIAHFDTKSFADEFACCERNIGWPMIVAVSAMETGFADESAGLFCRRIIAFLDLYSADPDRFYMDANGPVWWRCAFRDGSKPFMLGVLGEALDRYSRLTGDSDTKIILQRIVEFILKLHDPVRMDFEYEYNAYGAQVRHTPAQQLIPLFIRTLLSGTYSGQMDNSCQIAISALHACTWCLFDMSTGKDIALMTRGFLPALAIVMQIIRTVHAQKNSSVLASEGKDLIGWKACEAKTFLTLEEGVFSDRGIIKISYKPGNKPMEYLNTQAFFHVCDVFPNQSSVSVITFYNRIQVRFYGNDGDIIDSLDFSPEPSFFHYGSEHILIISYKAPGVALLTVDGILQSEILLEKPISGSFHEISVGYKPGNWSVNGHVCVEADFGRNLQN